MARKRMVAIVGLIALGTAIVGGPATASQDARAKSITVNLAGVSFSPKSVKAKVGDKIKFVWKNGSHNAYLKTAPKGVTKPKFGADAVASSGTKLSKAFAKKGTYLFECKPHASLGMRVSVKVS
jgi:plastocyanin